MAGSFNTIPNSLDVPLFYLEMDNSQASTFTQDQKTLLIGQMLSTGLAEVNTPMLVSGTDYARELFGKGAMLSRMHKLARSNDPLGEIWCIALADDGSAQSATGKVSITGPATASGTIYLYIAGQLVKTGVTSGDVATAIATAMVAAINANTNLPVTAAVNGTNAYEVDLTTKWKGETGNNITLMLNYYGATGGEKTPAGVALTITAMAGGSTNPAIADAIAVMGDEEYDFILHPYTDTANLNAMRDEMNDSAGRWSYLRQIWGHVYTAKRDTLANLVTLGSTRNDQHNTLAGYEVNIPNPEWEYAAAYGARNAVYIKADPARPTQTGPLVGILPAPNGKRLTITERQALLSNGIATSYTDTSGVVHVERARTTYQKNSFDEPDNSYFDSETMHTSSTVNRRLKRRITSNYGRHKLANDGTRFGAGQAIVTPSIIRGALIDEYYQMERLGLVENADLFAKYLIVERDAENTNRVNVLFPPDYINQLRVMAVQNQFRLQYPETA